MQVGAEGADNRLLQLTRLSTEGEDPMDEKTQAKIAAAYVKGVKAERKRINQILSEEAQNANAIEDRQQKKERKGFISALKSAIKDSAPA
jgi:hypothetical protein